MVIKETTKLSQNDHSTTNSDITRPIYNTISKDEPKKINYLKVGVFLISSVLLLISIILILVTIVSLIYTLVVLTNDSIKEFGLYKETECTLVKQGKCVTVGSFRCHYIVSYPTEYNGTITSLTKDKFFRYEPGLIVNCFYKKNNVKEVLLYYENPSLVIGIILSSLIAILLIAGLSFISCLLCVGIGHILDFIKLNPN